MEIVVRCVVFLIRSHQTRLLSILSLASASTALITRIGVSDECDGLDILSLPQIISELRTTLRHHIGAYRSLIGTNLTSMRFMLRVLESQRSFRDRDPLLLAPLGGATSAKEKRRLSVSDQTRRQEMGEGPKKKKSKPKREAETIS
jgi:hypothetical protein